ncbi:hypothetical protein OUZ56_033146 [Daphnia magna]|uniref:Uncharacterized protein n=1 Tax=Daphnia magna TaxID=35525 RepID=A0ABR0BAC8_9CRUS|nr:hypothetical protein OUZ56_033146 [Daphnia magna]
MTKPSAVDRTATPEPTPPVEAGASHRKQPRSSEGAGLDVPVTTIQPALKAHKRDRGPNRRRRAAKSSAAAPNSGAWRGSSAKKPAPVEVGPPSLATPPPGNLLAVANGRAPASEAPEITCSTCCPAHRPCSTCRADVVYPNLGAGATPDIQRTAAKPSEARKREAVHLAKADFVVEGRRPAPNVVVLNRLRKERHGDLFPGAHSDRLRPCEKHPSVDVVFTGGV